MADGRHFRKLLKSTDFDEIWHDDAYWPPIGDWLLKFRILKIQDGGGCLPENHKNSDILATD